MIIRSVGTPRTSAGIATTTRTSVDISDASSASVQVVYSNAAPAVKTFTSATYEVQTLTFAAKAATTHQDLVIVSNAAGLSFAVALTKPVAEVQTLTVPAGAAAAASRDFVILTDGSGLTWATYFDTSGTDVAPTAAAYTAVNAARKIKTDITGLAANTDIVTAMTSALNGLTGFTAAITLSGTTTLIATMAVKAPCANPVIFAEDGIASATNFSGAETTAGVASVAPSGPLWTAVAGARKGLADISGDTTAAQVAARVETALNALTGFTASITTDDTAANGTMTLTQTAYGPTTNAVPKNASEAGAGSITAAETTAGYLSNLDEVEEYITISSHPYVTGTKVALTTAGGLPTGLSATDYWVISVDANTIQLASSLANAEAGTAVDFDDDGNGLHTLTAATSSGNVAKLQESNDNTNWVDVSGATVTIATSTSSALWNYTGSSRYIGVLYTPSAGQVNLAIYSNIIKQS